jgi:hypothetical protein
LLAEATGLDVSLVRPENDDDRVLQGSAIRALVSALTPNTGLIQALERIAGKADAFDGVPPPKYYGDTDCELRYPDSLPLQFTLGDARAARDAYRQALSGLGEARTTPDALWEALSGLELTEDGYSLRTPYDGDVDGDGRHIAVGGEIVVTFSDSDGGEKVRDAILALTTTGEVLAKRVFLAAHWDGWRGNQLRRDVQHDDAEKSWALYVSNGALAKAIEATAPTPRNIGEARNEALEAAAKVAEAWGGAYSAGPVHSTRTYIAAQIRAAKSSTPVGEGLES